MSVYKEEKTNTWRVIYRYTNWTGQRKQSQKRGFKTKREAQAWEREQMNKVSLLEENIRRMGLANIRAEKWDATILNEESIGQTMS